MSKLNSGCSNRLMKNPCGDLIVVFDKVFPIVCVLMEIWLLSGQCFGWSGYPGYHSDQVSFAGKEILFLRM